MSILPCLICQNPLTIEGMHTGQVEVCGKCGAILQIDDLGWILKGQPGPSPIDLQSMYNEAISQITRLNTQIGLMTAEKQALVNQNVELNSRANELMKRNTDLELFSDELFHENSMLKISAAGYRKSLIDYLNDHKCINWMLKIFARQLYNLIKQ